MCRAVRKSNSEFNVVDEKFILNFDPAARFPLFVYFGPVDCFQSEFSRCSQIFKVNRIGATMRTLLKLIMSKY